MGFLARNRRVREKDLDCNKDRDIPPTLSQNRIAAGVLFVIMRRMPVKFCERSVNDEIIRASDFEAKIDVAFPLSAASVHAGILSVSSVSLPRPRCGDALLLIPHHGVQAFAVPHSTDYPVATPRHYIG